MTRETSIQAYRRLQESGRDIPQRLRIYAALYPDKAMTRAELEQATGIRLSSVCGRVKELLSDGYLDDRETRKCRITGENVHVVTLAQQIQLF